MNDVQARRVLRVLTAAFPTYPFESDTAELYEQALVRDVEDGALALEVAVDWATTRVTFPRVAELVEECHSEAGRRVRKARARSIAQAKQREGLVACQRCQDHKYVESQLDTGTVAMPCPDCQPESHRYWMDGHYDPDHEPALCEHPKCKESCFNSGAISTASVTSRADGKTRVFMTTPKVASAVKTPRTTCNQTGIVTP